MVAAAGEDMGRAHSGRSLSSSDQSRRPWPKRAALTLTEGDEVVAAAGEDIHNLPSLEIQVSHILSSSSTNGQVTVWDLVGQKKRIEFHAGITHDDGRETLRIAIVRLTAIYLHAIGYVG